MKKYTGLGRKWVLMWIVIPILAFLLSMSSVYAYFTAVTSNRGGSATTGSVIVKISDENFYTSAGSTSVNLQNVLPGQTLTFAGKVLNDGQYAIYSIIEFSIVVGGEEVVDCGYFTADGKTEICEEYDPLVTYNVPATALNINQSVSFSHSYTLDLYDFDDDYQGEQIHFYVYARAIQQQNIASAIVATNQLLSSCAVTSRLPKMYKEVEYLESTGTQWIDIDYPLTSNITKLKTQTQFILTDKNGSASYLFGITTSTSPYYCYWAPQIHSNTNAFRFFHMGDSAYVTNGSIGLNTLYTFETYTEKNGTSYFINNGNKQSVSGGTWRVPAGSPYLFALNSSGTADRFTKAKLYYHRFIVDDVLVRDLVPCYRVTDHVAGMYDLVSGQFFTNQGSGTFGIGAVV